METSRSNAGTSRDEDRMARIEDWLYVVIVSALALYFVIGIVAWTWMLLAGITAPDAFTTILATIAGGLVGILSPLGSRSTRQTEQGGQEAEPGRRPRDPRG